MGEKKNSANAAHTALYRKYRPKSLDEVVGQEHVTQTIQNALKSGKISHAYLFTGPRGTGKTSVARILAHDINQTAYLDERTDLDIIEIDAASNRRIDDIRDLRDKVHIAPVSSKYKVYIIDEVHMLTAESFNALLKTLEEPPAHVVFILATTEAHKLPATILSRTQRHNFRLVKSEVAIKHLAVISKQENISIDQDALGIIAQHGGGSIRDSLSLLDQLSGSSQKLTKDSVEQLLGLASKEALKQLLDYVLSGNGPKILSQTTSLLQDGLTPSGIAMQLVAQLRDEAAANNYDSQTIRLMSKLLEVQSASYPKLKLETTLLGLAASNVSQVNIEKPAPKSPEPLSEPVESEAKTKPDAIKLKAAAPKSSSIDEQWSEILNVTKQKNNPLYTVLRLATPELENNQLKLYFSFGFHKKKIDESRYKALIAECVKAVTGQSYEVTAIVDKSVAKPINSLNEVTGDPAHASLISTVQDIMGGGEVVQV